MISCLSLLPLANPFWQCAKAGFITRVNVFGIMGMREWGDEQRKIALAPPEVKRSVQEVLDKHNIRTDIQFLVSKHLYGFGCIGTNNFRKGDAAIFIRPDVWETNRPAALFLIKNRIGHIAGNYDVLIRVIAGVSSGIFALLCIKTHQPLTASIPLTWAVSQAALTGMYHYAHYSAYAFAIENSSTEELLRGRQLLLMKQYRGIEIRTKSFIKNRLFYSKDGDRRMNLLRELPIAKEIALMDMAIKKRGYQINEKEERSQALSIMYDTLETAKETKAGVWKAQAKIWEENRS
jgi:hypothetical protein